MLKKRKVVQEVLFLWYLPGKMVNFMNTLLIMYLNAMQGL